MSKNSIQVRKLERTQDLSREGRNKLSFDQPKNECHLFITKYEYNVVENNVFRCTFPNSASLSSTILPPAIILAIILHNLATINHHQTTKQSQTTNHSLKEPHRNPTKRIRQT